MPRDANGTYTLPAGNPVVTGTVIESNWANNTMADIATALTDSLSRTGQGAMLAPFRFSDGSESAPAGSFTLDTDTGFYRAGDNDFRITAGAQDVARFTASALEVEKTIQLLNNLPQVFKNNGGSPTAQGAFRIINTTGNVWEFQKANAAGSGYITVMSFGSAESAGVTFPLGFGNIEDTQIDFNAPPGGLSDVIRWLASSGGFNIIVSRFDDTLNALRWDYAAGTAISHTLNAANGELRRSNSSGSVDPNDLGVLSTTRTAAQQVISRSDGAGGFQDVLEIPNDNALAPRTLITPTEDSSIIPKEYVDNQVKTVALRIDETGSVVTGTLPTGWGISYTGAPNHEYTITTNDSLDWLPTITPANIGETGNPGKRYVNIFALGTGTVSYLFQRQGGGADPNECEHVIHMTLPTGEFVNP